MRANEVKMEINLFNIAVGAFAGALAGATIALLTKVQALKRLATKMKTWRRMCQMATYIIQSVFTRVLRRLFVRGPRGLL